MYRIIITFADGHELNWLVYADSDDHAFKIAQRKYGRVRVRDVRAIDMCVQIHEVREMAMQHLENGTHG